MKEIEIVIDKLKDSLREYERANTEDQKAIAAKEDQINVLTNEIAELKNGMEERRKPVSLLQRKISETSALDNSLKEVAPIIANTEAEKKEEAAPTQEVVEEPVVEEAKEEAAPELVEDEEEQVIEATVEPGDRVNNPFEDVVEAGEEAKDEEPFTFKSRLDAFNAPIEDNKDDFVIPTRAGGPVFDENGFDISATANNGGAFPSLDGINMNEMYNQTPEDDAILRP